MLISKLIQVLLSVKEILPPTSQLHITGVLNTLFSTIRSENVLDGIISALDTLKGVVLSVSDGYRQATGNGKQADLIFNILTECLERMSRLQQIQKRASDGKDIVILLCVKVVVWKFFILFCLKIIIVTAAVMFVTSLAFSCHPLSLKEGIHNSYMLSIHLPTLN